jgi:K+-sensing histidine kinase KdpD
MLAHREATQRLATLNEQKHAFLIAISHELRTPLTGILGAALTLERAGGRLSEEATADLIRGLGSSAHKVNRPLNNLIDLEQPVLDTIPLHRRHSTSPRCGTGGGPLAFRFPWPQTAPPRQPCG